MLGCSVPDCIKTAGRALTDFGTALIHTTANFANALPCLDGKLCSEMYTNYVFAESANEHMRGLAPTHFHSAEACAHVSILLKR